MNLAEFQNHLDRMHKLAYKVSESAESAKEFQKESYIAFNMLCQGGVELSRIDIILFVPNLELKATLLGALNTIKALQRLYLGDKE